MKRACLFGLLSLGLVACGGETPETFTVALSADKTQGAAPLAVNFSAAVPGGDDRSDNDVGYVWDFGTGDTVQGSASRPYVFTEAGTFEVVVEASTAEQRASDTVTVNVTEAPVTPGNQAPVVELEASATAGKAPLEVAFRASAADPNGDALSYSWSFGDGTTVAAGVGATQTHAFTATGSYAVVVTVDDGKGGVDQAELQIAVANPDDIDAPPTEPPATPDESDNQAPAVTLAGSTSGGSAPLTVSFKAEASDPEGDPLTYAWTFGNGERAEGNSSRTVIYDEPGEYTAGVVVSDGVAQEQASFRVTVDEPAESPTDNTLPVVRVSATPVSGSTPLRVAFEAEASDADGDDLSYLWDFGDGTISSDNPTTHIYREAGSYSASVTVSDGSGGKTRKQVAISATGSGEPTVPDVPYYGEWAWAARTGKGKTFTGYLSVSQRSSEPDDPEFADNFVEGGMGAWTYCEDGLEACGAPTGLGYIDVVDYGQGNQFDIIFVDRNTGYTTMIAFDDDDQLGDEVDGAPTFQGGGAWIYDDGRSDDLSFAMVKVENEPQTSVDAALNTLSAQRNRSR